MSLFAGIVIKKYWYNIISFVIKYISLILSWKKNT